MREILLYFISSFYVGNSKEDNLQIYAVIKYVVLCCVFIISIIWGLLSFRYISLLLFMFLLLGMASYFLNKKRKIIYIIFSFYLCATIIPIDIRTPQFEYDVPMPTFKIIPLLMGYPTDVAIKDALAGEQYLGGDVSTGFEPKWVILWQTDLVHLNINNYFDLLLYLGL